MALVSSALAPAQTSVPTTRPAAVEETIVLTPFMVDSTRDVGFVAASALAGGRLATDLKNTPVAYTVLTRDFIDALGLTDVTNASTWTVNSSFTQDDGRSVQFGSTGMNVRVSYRGAASDQARINFFPAYFDYDSFNLERFDFARGPNSILFGSGSNGGSANALYKEARLDKAFREVQVRIGSWENYRATVDFNQPLSRRVAARVNVLWQDNGSWRTREFEDRRAASLHLAWQPWPRARITAVSDRGIVRRNVGLTTLGDRISGWDGTTTYPGPLAAAPAAATGTERLGSPTAPFFVFSPGQLNGAIVNWANTAGTQGGGQLAGTPIGGQPIVGASINQNAAPLLDTRNIPANFLNRVLANSRWTVPGRDFSPTFDGDSYKNTYGNTIVSATQRLGRHLHFGVSANQASGYRGVNYIVVRGLNNVFIDINRNLPTGATNPNFLQPYNESTHDFDDVNTRSNNYRASAAAVFDQTRLGDFRFNVELGRDHAITLRNKYRYAIRDPLIDSRTWMSNTLVRWRYYYNYDPRPAAPLGDVAVVNPVAGTTRTLPSGYVLDTARPTETVRTRNNFDYGQAAVHVSFWKNRINLLGAVRQDDWSSNSDFTDFAMDLPVGWNGREIIYKPDAPANYYGLTYSPKNAAGVVTGARTDAAVRPRAGTGLPLPEYANDVFQDDFSPPTLTGKSTTYSYGAVMHVLPWLGLFANYAETWAPPGSNLRIDGSIFEPVTSEGWDAGLRLNLFGGRLQGAVTRYGTKQMNLRQSTGSGSAGLSASLPGAINGIISTNVLGDLSASGINNRGLQLVPSTYEDRAARKSKGYEFELIANLSRGWRLFGNLAFADATQGDGFADTRAYLEKNLPTLRQILADAGVSVAASGQASVNPGVTTVNSPDSTNAVLNWNSLQSNLVNLTPADQKVSRLAEVTGNLYTDYTIQAGRLKGLRFGAGLNYRGKEVIGYRGGDTMVDPANPANAIDDPRVGPLDPVYRPAYYVTTATFGYTFRLRHRLPVRLDLTVNNALDEDVPLFYNVAQRPPGGNLSNPARVATPNQHFYLTPRNFSLSATLSF